jgi:integrase/recombinase XerD
MISNVSPHWMRHTYAAHALENGTAITLVKETLGHSSLETTARYTHVRPHASSGQYLKV